LLQWTTKKAERVCMKLRQMTIEIKDQNN
jgi:hypothetical protein